MKLYKYLEREHALSLTNEGSLKIGTLYDWQATEKYGAQVGDATEAFLTRKMGGPVTITELPDFMKKADVKIVFEPGASLTAMEGIYVKHPCENLFGYACSKVFSLEILSKLCEDSKIEFDACVEISEPDSFFELIEKAMLEHGTFLGHRLCDYSGRTINHDAPVPQDFPWLKNPTYSYQNEVRALWKPHHGNAVTPLILSVPNIKALCKIIY